MKKIKYRFKNFFKSNSLIIRITLIMLLIVGCLSYCFGYSCGLKQSISVKADEGYIGRGGYTYYYSSLEQIPIYSTSSNYNYTYSVSSTSVSGTVLTLNTTKITGSTNCTLLSTYGNNLILGSDYSACLDTVFMRLYYDNELFVDSYLMYSIDNDFTDVLTNIYLYFLSSNTSYPVRYGNKVIINVSDINIFHDYLPQLFSLQFFKLSSDYMDIRGMMSIGDYISYNHIDDMDSYNAGYLAGYDDGVADTVSQYSGDGEDDGSYQEGYQDGYNIGYQSGLFSTVAQSYNWIVYYNYWVAPLKLTDTVNSIDLTNTNSYYYLGITFRLSSNFSVSEIASIDCCINNTPNSLIYNYYSDGTYDHPSGVGYGNINTYSSSSYETGGGSYSGLLSYPYIPYTISSSCQGWNVYDYSGFDNQDSPFSSIYTNLDITKVTLPSGDYCNSFNDFIEYNRQYYYSTDFDLYNSNAAANNEISLYFIINSDQFNFDDMLSNMSLTIRLTDNTSHPIQKATWIQSLFSSSNSYVNFRTGYNLGYSSGFRVGESVGLTNSELLKDTMWAVMDSPFHMLKQVLNFNLLGINLWQVFTGVISVVLLIWLIKKFLV